LAWLQLTHTCTYSCAYIGAHTSAYTCAHSHTSVSDSSAIVNSVYFIFVSLLSW
jgi:hypothetical protein